MDLLTIIIPAHDKWDLTRACLASLAKHSANHNFEIILADNGSTDLTAGIAEAFGRGLFGDNFKVLRFERNINFGPACNAAAKLAAGDLLFFLNNDTLLTDNWLPPLLGALGQPGTAGVGPLLLYQNNTVQHLGVVIEPAGTGIGHLYAGIAAKHRLAQKHRSFPAITAAAMLLPRQKFMRAGAFNEAYINGFEDVDLCFRLTGNGEVMRVVPESVIYHLESRSAGRHNAEAHNSRLLSSTWNMADHANMQAIAAGDGYIIQVGPGLEAMLTPTPERVSIWLKQLGSASQLHYQATFLRILEDEPYWEAGYHLLAGIMETRQQWEEAMGIYYKSLSHNPSLLGHENLLRVAKIIAQQQDTEENRAMVAALTYTSQQYRQKILDEAAYNKKLKYAVGTLYKRNQPELAAAYARAGQLAVALRAQWQREQLSEFPVEPNQ